MWKKKGGGSNKLLVFMISTVLMESDESICKCYIDLKHYSDNRLENINFHGNAWFFVQSCPNEKPLNTDKMNVIFVWWQHTEKANGSLFHDFFMWWLLSSDWKSRKWRKLLSKEGERKWKKNLPGIVLLVYLYLHVVHVYQTSHSVKAKHKKG